MKEFDNNDRFVSFINAITQEIKHGIDAESVTVNMTKDRKSVIRRTAKLMAIKFLADEKAPLA